jgi:hypothetical protein
MPRIRLVMPAIPDQALREIARRRSLTVSQLGENINAEHRFAP